MSLYNLYRPNDWDSVIGQEYITTILRNSLKMNRVHHAYLFHGSRGTGKTTSARILAEAVNCTNLQEGNPCHTCANCLAFDDERMLDVIEIDGASNNGVENVRDLIEKARFEPNQGAYKVYIIDEVHMLSIGAFNALLKIIEQPPSHVKFILATTEIDKVPETIRSRTLRFDFRKITLEDIITRLKYVCDSEKIRYEEEALKIIAKAARGGLRDALTHLEQNILDGEISTEHVRYTLALVDEAVIEFCIDALENEDIKSILKLLDTLREKHLEARGFFEQLMYRIRDRMMEDIEGPRFFLYSEMLEMLESAYAKIRSIPDGMILIEVTLLRIVRRNGERGSFSKKEPIEEVKIPKNTPPPSVPAIAKAAPKIKENPPTPLPPEEKTAEKIKIEITPENPEKQKNDVSSFSYPNLINHLRTNEIALTTDLKMARFQIDGTTFSLIFTKKWNYDRVNTAEKKRSIVEALETLHGGLWKVECKLSEGSSGLSDVVHEVF